VKKYNSLTYHEDKIKDLVNRVKSQTNPATIHEDERSSLERKKLENPSVNESFDTEKNYERARETEKVLADCKAKRKQLKNELTGQLLDMRVEYARKAYRFVWLWSVALIVTLMLQGSKNPTLKLWFLEIKAAEFNLDSSVLIALISGVTVNIVAVFVVVIRNLFPQITTNSKNKN
jgi:cation transport ATPase